MSTSWTFTMWPWLYFNRVLNKVLFMYKRHIKFKEQGADSHSVDTNPDPAFLAEYRSGSNSDLGF
jgi:hypothetical protein